MKIAADINQFAGSHGNSNKLKHEMLKELGCEVVPTPLCFGDYCQITDQMQETIDRRGSKLKKADLVGDIKISVDTKASLSECAMNICSSSHARFRDEVILAQKCGCKLYILVEEKGINSIDDVFKWQNPRLHNYNKIAYMHSIGKWGNVKLPKGKPTSGQTLAKAMLTTQLKYGCEFLFTTRYGAAAKIVELLGGDVG